MRSQSRPPPSLGCASFRLPPLDDQRPRLAEVLLVVLRRLPRHEVRELAPCPGLRRRPRAGLRLHSRLRSLLLRTLAPSRRPPTRGAPPCRSAPISPSMAARRLRISLPTSSSPPSTATRRSSCWSLRSRCRAAAEPMPSCNARSRASRTRRERRPVRGALRHGPLVDLQHPRRALVALLPHQLLQQRHQPHQVHLLDVLAVLDAVFGGLHRLASCARFSTWDLHFSPRCNAPPPRPCFRGAHVILPHWSRRRSAPPPPAGFFASRWNPLFHRSVHRLRPVGGPFTPVPVRHVTHGASATKAGFLYTPILRSGMPEK